MDKKHQFLAFLDGLKGCGQDVLVESVKQGFRVCMESEIEEKSMEDKLYEMNKLGYDLAYGMYDENPDLFSEEEKDFVWAVADGLIEKWVKRQMAGETSLQSMIDNPPEKIEEMIDDKIRRLKDIKQRVSV